MDPFVNSSITIFTLGPSVLLDIVKKQFNPEICHIHVPYIGKLYVLYSEKEELVKLEHAFQWSFPRELIDAKIS